MAVWTWVLGGPAPAGVERRQLTTAYGRTLALRVDAPLTAQFSLDGRSSEAAEIVALATDLHIYRDGVKMFRGRITTESDTIDETKHATQFTAVDYRAMLDFRCIGVGGVVFTQVDQGLIAWTLIQTSQAQSGGNWGITNGLGPTNGQLRDRTLDIGKPLGEAISELGHLQGGFEWDIDSTLALRRWYPTRGVSQQAVLDYGGNVAHVSRVLPPQNFANFVIVTGDMQTTPASAVSGTIATDQRGRFELAQPTTIIEQSTLDARATWLLGQTSLLTPELSVTMTPGQWGGLSHIGLGDTVRLSVKSGRLAFLGNHRVVEMMLVPGDDGTETITMGLVPV